MHSTVKIFWQYLRSFILIYACLYAGIFIASLLPIAIPGSIIGMLIMFTLLALQIMPAKWVKPSSHLLIRYMALLFCAYWGWGDAILRCTESAVRPDCYLLSGKYTGGYGGRWLEFSVGSRQKSGCR